MLGNLDYCIWIFRPGQPRPEKGEACQPYIPLTSQYRTRQSASLRALSPCAYLVSESAGELVSLRITEQENWCITHSSALDPAPELMYLADGDGQDNSKCVHVWQHMQLSGLWSCAGAASCNRNQAHQTALSSGITVQ